MISLPNAVNNPTPAVIPNPADCPSRKRGKDKNPKPAVPPAAAIPAPAAAAPAPVPAAPPERLEPRISFEHNGRLVETVVTPPGVLRFCVQGETELVNRIELGREKDDTGAETTVIAIPHPDILPFAREKVLLFPCGTDDYLNTEALLADICRFIKRYAAMPAQWVNVIALYVLMTWMYDRFAALPYLRFLGESGNGKTRFLEVTVAISYKGLSASGNITGAALFRTIDLFRGTIAVDEGDFRVSAEWSDMTKILNNGYAAGKSVYRCKPLTFQPEFFYVYGPKILSTRNRFDDDATENRCITFEVREKSLKDIPRNVPLQLTDAFWTDAFALRNKLLKWRMDYFHKVEAVEDGLRDGDLSPRVAQIGASLMGVLSTLPGPASQAKWKQMLIDFLTEMDADRKENSDRGAVLRAIDELKKVRWESASVGEIAKMVNRERGDAGLAEIEARRVGNILRSLDYSPRHQKHGNAIPLVPLAGGEKPAPVPAFRLLPERSPVNVGGAGGER